MEAEQEITLGMLAELESQLAEVRAKRDRLDAQNLRVTDNLLRIIEERDQAIATAESLRAEYLKHKEMTNTNSDNAASLREQLLEITAQRDTLGRYRDEMRVSRDEERTAVAELQGTIEELRAANKQYQSDWVVATGAAEMFEAENTALRDTIHTLRAKQIHPDLPGLLLVIQGAAEQARELI